MSLYGVACAPVPKAKLARLRGHIATMLDRKAATGRSPELMLNVQEKCVDPQAYILVQRVLALHRAICLFPELRQLLSAVV
eukprot:14039901-Alexandrium_andersonii.AAC.1